MKGTKVVIVGLDGADWRLLRRWIAEGRLPALAHIWREGATGTLFSVLPPFSAPAWTSFMTGVNPGQHGIFDFIQPQGKGYQVRVMNGGARRAPSLWRILTDRGRSVGVVNVPMTYPPEPVQGFFISGLDAPTVGKALYPPSLREAIKDYIIVPPSGGRTLPALMAQYRKAIQWRWQAFALLWERHLPDLAVVVFNASDAVQHLCLLDPPRVPYETFIHAIYKALDDGLTWLLSALPEEAVLIIMSDHGVAPLRAFFYLNHWLAQRGWLKLKRRKGRGKLARAYDFVRRHAPPALRGFLKQRLKWREKLVSLLTLGEVDWEHTVAYTCNMQGIYINLQGRQPAGIVSPGEYKDWCERITGALMEIRDPRTGEEVVERVYHKEELFSGPALDAAPDLYIRWKRDAYLARFDFPSDGESLFAYVRPWDLDTPLPARILEALVATHRPEGIVMLYGQGVQPGPLDRAHILDIAPTVLTLLDEPVPSYMEGKALEGISGR